jgi:basic membrane lipoprotein Med (substrate-binding protein (PBP1-ABC) superfamily)
MRRTRLLPALVLVGATAFGFVACVPDRQPEEQTFRVRLVTSVALSGRWERAAERGLGLIAATFDADVGRSRADGTDQQRVLLQSLARDGVDLLFCVGPEVEGVVFTEAVAFPDTVFVVLPGEISGANVASVAFMPEEAGYLAGTVAVAYGDSASVGVLRGVGRPWLERLEAGFVAGCQAERGDVEVVTASGPDGPWQLVSAGVEVALYATDLADPQVMAAVHDAGLQLVATDPELLDTYPNSVVAAVEVDVAEAMLRVAREVYDRTFSGRVFTFDLGSGVLDVLLSSDVTMVNRTSDLREVLERARTEITAGWVEIEELGIGQ